MTPEHLAARDMLTSVSSAVGRMAWSSPSPVTVEEVTLLLNFTKIQQKLRAPTRVKAGNEIRVLSVALIKTFGPGAFVQLSQPITEGSQAGA